jgi:hypothetical protein
VHELAGQTSCCRIEESDRHAAVLRVLFSERHELRIGDDAPDLRLVGQVDAGLLQRLEDRVAEFNRIRTKADANR